MLRKLLLVISCFLLLWACFGIAIFLTKALMFLAFWSIVMGITLGLFIFIYLMYKTINKQK